MVIGIDASHATKEQRTGVEEYCFQIIEHFKKIIPAEDRVILYTHELAGDLFSNLPTNWSVKVLQWPLKKMWSQTRLAFELLVRPPDVFFAPGQLISWATPKNTAVMVHDSAFKVFPEAYHFWGRQYLTLMNWWIVHRAQKVFTSSEFNRQELKRLYPWFDAAGVSVIPLAYDSGQFNLGPVPSPEFLKHYGITKPYLLFVGRLETKKNIRRLVEAFTLIKKYHDVQLVLVGKPGVGFAAIEKAFELHPNKADIIRPGFVQAQDLPDLFRGAAVFVFPSLYEGFGLPVLEAFASGCPVAASSGGALAEVGGAAARYFEPTDIAAIAGAVTKMLSNPAELNTLSQAGLQRAEFFSWEQAAMATYAAIVKKTK